MKWGAFHMVFKLVPSAQTLGFCTAAVSAAGAGQGTGGGRYHAGRRDGGSTDAGRRDGGSTDAGSLRPFADLFVYEGERQG